jgi:hypothetical protein
VKSSTYLNRSTTPEKEGSRHNPQPDWLIHGSVPSFSSEPTIKAVGKSQASVDNQLLGLPDPYHRHAIGTFNTCSWGSTHRSLNDTGGGYNLGGADLPHTTPQPSQPVVSTLHLRAPPGLRLRIQPLPIDLERDQILNLVSGSFHSTSTVTYHLSIA